MAVYKLKTPLTSQDVERLRVKDVVYLSGVIFTARDKAHERMLKLLRRGGKTPFKTSGLAVYHCGPVVKKIGGEWIVLAAGPTTSMRMEELESEFISKTGVKMVIGKGGMGRKTAETCKKEKCVYAVFVGGAAVYAAKRIKRVLNVYWLDMGVPEAVWVFEVEDFGPLTIFIDCKGENLSEKVGRTVKERVSELKAYFS